MKKSKILSLILAIAMLMSLVPSVVSAEFDQTIWEENFEGDATLASRVDSAAAGAVIEDGVLKTPSEAEVYVNSKNGAVADAPEGKIRVNFDMKAPNVGTAATKAELLTDAGTKVLICYGTWGCLRPHPTDGQYGSAGFDGDVWYNNDFVLDFENNKMYITVTKKSDGTKALDNYEYAIDLSSVTTIKGINLFGWAGDAYYDNFVIEYVEEWVEPEVPVFNPTIWEEDFEGDATLASRVDSAAAGAVIEDGVLKTPSEAEVYVNSKNGVVADAPLGKIRVNWDMKAPNVGTAATCVELYTDVGKKTLVTYGTWGGLRPNATNGQYGSAGFDGDEWYNNDFVLDFENNKMYITVTKQSDGTKSLDNYEYAIDLSSVTKVTGIYLFGWAGDAYYDNFVIEYVVGEFDVNADSISIWTNDYEEYIASVAPGANKMVIDFGTAVEEATLDGAVTFTNVTDNANVEFEGTLSGTKYTMVFDGLLANRTYKVAISGNVENILGETIGHDYELSFTTTSGSFKAKLKGFTQNSTEVVDFANLVAGDGVVSFDFEKTTPGEKTVKVIYAYYIGNKMEKVDVHTVTIGEAEKSGTKSDDVTISDLTGITGVSIMLWEDLIDIMPLCTSIDL